jgi:PDZ domain-containing protein
MTEATYTTTRPRHRRWLFVAVLVVVVAVLTGVASSIELPYYALSPGQATPVTPRIVVPAGRSHRIHGAVLLTDVLLSPVSLLDYLPDRWSSDTSLVPADEVLGPATPPAQLSAQGYLEMAQSQAAAKAAALSRLGYRVGARDAGVLIFAVQPGSPAAGVVMVGQIVTAVGTTPTPNACALVSALYRRAPGSTITLSVEQSSVTSNATLVPGKVVERTVRLGRPPAGSAASGCPGVSGPSRGYLGVEIETWQDFSYPIRVEIDTSDIGGPSAGLAMTLGIIDKLGGGDLTGGAVVAATGTIDPSGAVGDVGGVAQKTVAVERAGATAFLVPPEEFKVAKAKADPSLHVYAVSSLDRALAVLKRLGGHVPAASEPSGAG